MVDARTACSAESRCYVKPPVLSNHVIDVQTTAAPHLEKDWTGRMSGGIGYQYPRLLVRGWRARSVFIYLYTKCAERILCTDK